MSGCAWDAQRQVSSRRSRPEQPTPAAEQMMTWLPSPLPPALPPLLAPAPPAAQGHIKKATQRTCYQKRHQQ